MRIGISTSVIQRGRTGIAQYLFALTRALLAHAERHQFVLFVLEEDLELFQFARCAMTIIPVPEQYRDPVRDILWHQTVLPRLAREQRLDVLHVPSYRRMVWRRPCARVATIHDVAPFRVTGKYDWKRMLYGRVIARRLARRQERIIAVSRCTAQDIARYFGVPPGRVTVIHNGVDRERFHPGSRVAAREFARERYGLERPFFLYVARLEHPGKNHVRLISAFNQFRRTTAEPWQLVLAGGDWHGADVIHAAVRSSPFASEIRTLGFVKDEDLPGLYRAAEAFVYPSLYEGFGMPPTEAMACGCPVISSARGALAEVVGEAAAIVEPESVESIAEQLLAVAGREQAGRFTWENAAARTLEVYGQAAGELAPEAELGMNVAGKEPV